MTGILANWKTTVVGLAAGASVIAASAYKGGMTWKEWALAASLALLGALSRDFNVTSEKSGAK